MKILLSLLLIYLLVACSESIDPSSSQSLAKKGIYSANFSADGEMSFVGSLYEGGSLWRDNNGIHQRTYNWNHKKDEATAIKAARFSPDNRFLLSADNHRTLVLWDIQTGKSISFWTAPGEILDVDLTKDAKFALLGLRDHSAVVFDLQRGGVKQTFRHQGKVNRVAFGPQGSIALSGSDDYQAVLWRVENGEVINRWSHSNAVNQVAISPDGKTAFTSAQHEKASLWRVGSGEHIADLDFSGRTYSAVAFDPQANQLLTGTLSGKITLWALPEVRVIRSWKITPENWWKHTGISVIALGFHNQSFLAISSNGYRYQLN